VRLRGDGSRSPAQGTTPLVIASQYDHTVLVFFLVQQRADINLLDVYSDSALHWAAYKNNQQTVALLHYLGTPALALDPPHPLTPSTPQPLNPSPSPPPGLPADAADSYGSTPMHLASAQGSLQARRGWGGGGGGGGGAAGPRGVGGGSGAAAAPLGRAR